MEGQGRLDREGVRLYSICSRPPNRLFGELGKWCGEECQYVVKDFRWKDGGMEGWKRPMKVPFTHTGRKDILRPMSTIAFLEQERTNFFRHTVLGQGVQKAGQKDR